MILLRAPAFQRKLVRLSSRSNIRSYEDCRSQWKEIDKKLWDLFDVYYYHYITSAQSGTYYITVGQIMAGGTIPGKHEQEMIASLFTSINGIKSAEALQKGEIMVARFTDVGWTPYFGIAGGIIT